VTRLLVNFFYAQQLGHAIEALHYANGYHVADPSLEIGVAMNAATPVELASACPFVTSAYAIDHPFVDRCADSDARLALLPPDWDWVVDDARRYQDFQLGAFPGMRDYYAASDRRLNASEGRRPIGYPPPAYTPHAGLRLELPEGARAKARLEGDGPAIALMPAGSAGRAMYPSVESWMLILDALAEALPDVRFVLIGRLSRDERSSTSFGRDELEALLAHRSAPVDGFDVPLLEQLALVEACDVFLSPHTGFGLAALAVGTPWLTLSGGRWFEYFFNRVPFRSILPDVERYPSFSQFAEPPLVDGRTPSMSHERVVEDLDRIVAGAGELITGSLGYERALREYFAGLLAAHGGDATAIWSIDGVHADYLPRG
jgi:hypothetical protein